MKRLAATLTLTLAVLAAPAAAGPFPDRIPLPRGIQPEGIATGHGTTFYVGSIPTGDVYRGDYRTGAVSPFVDAPDGRAAIGLEESGGLLFVAGGPTGDAYVYDATTGEPLRAYDLASGATFVNDVAVARGFAYFTDSLRPVLYRVPVEGGEATEIALDVPYESGFNLNGIAATPNGKTLFAVQSNTGVLWRIDPRTGAAAAVDTGGQTLTMGDGLLLQGRTLYVVRNFANEVVELRLDPHRRSARAVQVLRDEDFDVPTTLARHGSRLYAVNARFGIEDPGSAAYDVVRVDR